MPEPTPTYDLVLLLHTSADAEARQKLVVDIDKLIQEQGSLLEGREWGVRKLAYPILDEESAEYRVSRFQGPAELLSELDRQLKIAAPVLRHRIIRLERNPVPLPDLSEAPAVANKPAASKPAKEEAPATA